MNKHTFRLTKVAVADVAVHPLVIAFGYDYKPADDAAYNEQQLSQFNIYEHFYDRPVAVMVEGCYLILTHTKDFYFLKQTGVVEMEVYVAGFESDMEVQQFVGFRNGCLRRDWKAQYHVSQNFLAFLESPEGKEKKSQTPGKKTRAKVAFLMATSDSTIQRIWEIGDNEPKYLDMITNGHISYTEASVQMKKNKYGKGKPKEGANEPNQEETTETGSSETYVTPDGDHTQTQPSPENGSPGPPSTEEPSDDSPEEHIEQIELFKFAMIDGVPIVTYNGKENGSMSLKTTRDIVNGSGRIHLKDNRSNGPEYILTIKNAPKTKVVPFERKDKDSDNNENKIAA